MVTSTSAISAVSTSTTPSKESGSLTKLTGDFNTFVKLLVSQIQNQNPLEPTDTAEFTNQLVQFSNVEQNIAANSKLQQLIDLSASNQTATAVSYTGKQVEIKSDQFVLKSTEAAKFAYSLDKSTDRTQIEVRDEKGVIIYKAEGQTLKGRHTVDLSQVELSGPANPGLYTVSVVARGSADEEFKPVTTYTTGTVTAVNLENGDVASIIVDDKIQTSLQDITFVGAEKINNTGKSPVISGYAGEVEYAHQDTTSVLVDSDLIINDDDSSTISGAVIVVDNIKDGDDEKFNVTLQEGITIKSNQDGILVLSGVATREAYQNVLRSLTYQNTNTTPDTTSRDITIVVGDGANNSNTVNKTIKFI